jgi:26S proteasome regulatory subunit N10
MRNGDYVPTRIQAQSDAATFLFNAKTQSNPENSVGLMTMGGKAPNVLVTLTTDFGKILSALHHVKIDGSVSLSTGVSIAQLVLKHRQNKNQKQRIIVFVASPVAEDEETLVKLGKKLKKNNVAVDIIAFGSEGDMNEKKLESFINTVNSSDNSHLVTIPPGPHVLSDILISSPIVSGGESSSGGGGFEFGVDPSLDPELALALRISMEEEKARQEKLSTNTVKEPEKDVEMMDLTEDEQIARALAMSMEASFFY